MKKGFPGDRLRFAQRVDQHDFKLIAPTRGAGGSLGPAVAVELPDRRLRRQGQKSSPRAGGSRPQAKLLGIEPHSSQPYSPSRGSQWAGRTTFRMGTTREPDPCGG
jgi:hypothetical protein